MGQKLEAARKYRAENSWKWKLYFDNGGRYTMEVRAKMKADNEILEKLAHEATLEWLEERGVRKKEDL